MSLCGLGLSCEPLPCEHGKELRKEQCHLCELKRQVMALTDMYKELSVRVMAQHEFKLRQIDENQMVAQKILEINETLKAWDEDFEYLDSLKLPKRISKLEKNNKIPHKCPLCDGCGVAGELALTHCNSCQGTGIVWG
jgi:hypothetical protein